jgi:hypothetical protein
VQLADVTGGFDRLKIFESSPASVTALVKARK